MAQLDFNRLLEPVLHADLRYQRDAYHFVRTAIDHTHLMLAKQGRPVRGHISGQQLLDGIRDLALAQFGPMSELVLEEWGIRSCEDFGEIVFNMVDHQILRKTEKDNRADFKGGYTFREAFRKPFQPTISRPSTTCPDYQM